MKRYAAFSLIEMVIVISIITIMSTIGITSYRSAKRGILIDIESDKLVVLMQKMRSQTRAGGQTKPQCFGVFFKLNEKPQQLVTTYNTETKKCNAEGADAETSDIEWSDELALQHITADQSEPSELKIFFLPPHGDLKMKPLSADLLVGFTGGFPQQRRIFINGASGTIEKTKL